MKHKLLTMLLALIASLCLCLGLAACGGGEPEEEKGADGHTHTAEHFQVDENGHWKTCTICGEKFSVGNHNYNSDNACKTCGYSAVYTKGLKYELDEDTDTYIVMGLGEAKDTTDLIIPAYYEGKAVTEICEFKGCVGLTSITIPDGVTSIGVLAFKGTAYYNDAANWDSAGVLYIGNHLIEAKKYNISGSYTVKQGTKTIAGYAFAGVVESGIFVHWLGCLNLTSIVIPDSVTSIGDQAFYGCSGLTSITIPDSVTSIGYGVFGNCSGLESISVLAENPKCKSEQNCLIEKDTNTLIAGCKNSKIPFGVTSIGDYAFMDCDRLTSVTIPDGVTSIGEAAFSGCSRLTSIAIPDSVTEIENFAFSGCSRLTSIEIPNSVTSIGDSAFSGCYSLTSIAIPDSVTEIENFAFSGCSRLTSIEIGNGVTSIGAYAFDDCDGLTSVTIPDGVTSIGHGAFFGCSRLTDIQFKGTVEEWQGIQKGNALDNNYTGTYTVTCTDGTIAKDGTVTYFNN